MELQVVSNFNLANNESTSFLQAQTSQEWNYKLIPILNNRKLSYKLFSTLNESGMKLQVVSNLNLANKKQQVVYTLKQVKNETTSWF